GGGPHRGEPHAGRDGSATGDRHRRAGQAGRRRHAGGEHRRGGRGSRDGDGGEGQGEQAGADPGGRPAGMTAARRHPSRARASIPATASAKPPSSPVTWAVPAAAAPWVEKPSAAMRTTTV